MKYILSFLVLITMVMVACSKDGRGCWQAWDGLLVEVNGLVVCDKTKAEARAAYGQFLFCPKGERKYCWVSSTGNHYHCIPKTIIEDWGGPRGMTFTKESCTRTCRNQSIKNTVHDFLFGGIAEAGIFKRNISENHNRLSRKNLLQTLTSKPIL